MDTEDNVKASTAAFCTFSPFKSWWARLWNRLVLMTSPIAIDEVRKRKFLHYAYFVQVLPKHLRRSHIPARGTLRRGGLLFISAYNGSAELYFRGFSRDLHKQMDDLWKSAGDWKGAQPYENLDAFIQKHRRRAGTFFNAYEETSTNLRTALRLRSDMDRLLATARTGSDADFLREYKRMAQVAWGNAER